MQSKHCVCMLVRYLACETRRANAWLQVVHHVLTWHPTLAGNDDKEVFDAGRHVIRAVSDLKRSCACMYQPLFVLRVHTKLVAQCAVCMDKLEARTHRTGCPARCRWVSAQASIA